MISLAMSLYIVVAFFVLTLAIGISSSRKKITFREYAVGNKDFSTITLVSTMLATLFGGGLLIRNVTSIHALGLYQIVILLLYCFGLWLLGRLALRMGPFMRHLSMAETIGSIYGKSPRVIAALVGICTCIIIITIQINIMSQVLDMCFRSIDSSVITILATLLLIFYCTFGGVRAIVFTDLAQLLVFSIIISLLAWFIFVKVGKPVSEMIPMLQNSPKFQFSNLFHFNHEPVTMILLALSLIVCPIRPDIMQRIYMATNPIQAAKALSYTTFFSLVIFFFMSLIGLFVFIDAPDLPEAAIWEYIIEHIPPLFKGFFAVGLLSMSMSTADSCLNTCSIMVSHDIFKSLHKEPEMINAFQLKIARWATFVVGLLAMLLALNCKDLLALMYWMLDCSVPIATAPLILAIFGFRGTDRSALIGMATGLLSILAWNKWVKPITDIDGSLLAMLANGLAMMAEHYLLKQPKGVGWVKLYNEFDEIPKANGPKRA